MLTRPNLLEMGPVKDLWDLADRLDMMPANDDHTCAAGFDIAVARVSEESCHPCGTAGCIGGWVCLWNKSDNEIASAVSALGCARQEALKLCFGFPTMLVSAQQAARAVRILAETGKCDWNRALREVPA